MRLSRIYCNRPTLFGPVDFKHGLNVVLAEIRLPENKEKDTHNLGKTTLGRLLDFCLLSGRDKNFFLFKQSELFDGFVFFLELELLDGSFLTVRRNVSQASKISFKRHSERGGDYTNLPDAEWDHLAVPFERARVLLDGLLDLEALKPWSFRKGIGYLLRTQDDFQDVFHLKKFGGAHSDWKPYLAHILGFNADAVASHYAKEDQLDKALQAAQHLASDASLVAQDQGVIEGMLLLKQKEAEKRKAILDEFDFGSQDREKTNELIERIDEDIASRNARRYSLGLSRKKIVKTLEQHQIVFEPEEAERLFKDAGILFAGQIKRDFEQLIEFNVAITEERRKYLEEDLGEVDSEIERLTGDLVDLNARRAQTLSFLGSTDVFYKYKRLSSEMVDIQADITSLERQREALRRLKEQRQAIRVLREEKLRLQEVIERDVSTQNTDTKSLFSNIRLLFSDVVEHVIDRKALLSVTVNQQGNLDFGADILDESGKATSAGLGHTYRKLLCMAFDLAVLRAHLDTKFPRFVYHDGAFESLDDRKKSKLIEVSRQYADLGIQHIITVIDSDLPDITEASGGAIFAEREIVLRLHDEDEQGRLFRMRGW